MNSKKPLWAIAVVVCASIYPTRGWADDRDERLLQDAGLATDEAGLLDLVRRQTGQTASPEDVQRLLKRLGSRRFAERQRASQELVGLGPAVLPQLRKTSNADPEVTLRVRACIRLIERARHALQTGAAVRLLARRGSKGAVKVLLDYLPHTADEQAEEVWYALDAVARRGGAGPALEAALDDNLPARRAVAACLLGRLGNAKQRAEARKSLNDRDPSVRLRAAQGLLAGGDVAAVPSLLALLLTTSLEVAWQAEELLHWAAGHEAPAATIGAGDLADRNQCHAAWERWWCEQDGRLDLTEALRSRRPGFLLVHDSVDRFAEEKPNRVWLCGCDGRPRVFFGEVPILDDMQLVSGGRVLMAEVGTSSEPLHPRVLECDGRGQVIWEALLRKDRLPVACRRLANGNTFICYPACAGEIDASGKKAVRVQMREENWPEMLHNIYRARRLPDGQVLCVLGDRKLCELDAGKVRVIDGRLPEKPASFRQAVILSDSTLLLRMDDLGNCLEVAFSGAVVRRFSFPNFADAVRLADGHTVAAVPETPPSRHGRLIEVDQSGRVVHEIFSERMPRLVRDCLGLIRIGFDGLRPATKDAGQVVSRVWMLHSDHRPSRRGAARALCELGPPGRAAIPALIAALADRDERMRDYARGALSRIGPAAIPTLVRALEDFDPARRAGAAIVLSGDNRVGLVVPELIALLRDDSAPVRQATADALGASAATARPAEAALIQLLSDWETSVQAAGARALRFLAATSPRARRALLGASRARDSAVRAEAATALGEVGRADERVVAALLAALKDEDESVRARAARSLGRVGRGARSVVPGLIEAFKVPYQDRPAGYNGEAVVTALGQLGPDARSAVPLLLEAFKNGSLPYHVRGAAGMSLGQIGPKQEVVAVFADSVRRDVLPFYAHSFYPALVRLGPAAGPLLVRTLQQRKKKQYWHGAWHFLWALTEAGPEAAVVVPELLKWLTEKDSETRGILLALGSIGPAAKVAVPVLIRVVHGNNPREAILALYALARISPDSATVRELLADILAARRTDPFLRAAAALAAAEIRLDLRPLRPALREALKGEGGGPDAYTLDRIRQGDFPHLQTDLAETKQDWRREGHEEYGLKACVCLALGRLHLRDRNLIPVLAHLVGDKDTDPVTRCAAAWALGRLGPEASATISALAGVLRDPDSPLDLRESAATALVRLGPLSVPALVESELVKKP